MTLTAKTLGLSASQSLTIGKQHFSPTLRSLSVDVGASIEIFNGSAFLDGKAVESSAGAIITLNKNIAAVRQKQVSVSLGWIGTLDKRQFNITGKPLSIVLGTNVPFIGELKKASLNVEGKMPDLQAATSISFIATMPKMRMSVSYSGLSLYTGNVLDLISRHNSLHGKQVQFVSTPEIKFIHIARLYNLRY